MTPLEASTRLAELGVSIDPSDFPYVNQLRICDQGVPREFAKLIAEMAPGTVTLHGGLMTKDDIPALLHFPSLQGIVAHRIVFANSLLHAIAKTNELKSIAMSNTAITDTDVAVLANHPGITSIHLARTQLTDAAMTTFGTLSNLELLDVSHTQVTNEGLSPLRNLRHLFTIVVKGTAVTDDGANQYRTSVANTLPDVEVLV